MTRNEHIEGLMREGKPYPFCSDRQNIVWIANCVVAPPESLGGGDRILVECSRRWTARHIVHVFGNEGAGVLLDYFNMYAVQFHLWPADAARKFGRVIWWLYQTFKSCQRVRSVPIQPDVIIATSEFWPNLLPALILKRRFPTARLVVCVFLLAPKWFSGRPGPGWLFTFYRPFQQMLIRTVIRYANVIFVTGEEDREVFLKMGRLPTSVYVVKGGVDMSVAESVPQPTEKIYDAVFIGRLHPQKGVLEMMHIWGSLVKWYRPDTKLAVIGTGPMETHMKCLVKNLGIERNVDFIGFLDGQEKYKIIKASKIVLHPAVYDSGGMAAAEGLVCGLPGVCFDLPSLRTYYEEGFSRVHPRHQTSFVNAIERLLDSKEHYEEMSICALREGRRWDWDSRAEKILNAAMNVYSLPQ